jgi:uncharacterized protein YuzE
MPRIHIHEVNFDSIEESENGTLSRKFVMGVERYLFDVSVCTSARGWTQYDTDQDAPYFGVWVHKENHEVVTFAEGDLTYLKARDADAFAAEIERMNAFYEPTPAVTTIDADGRLTRHYDEKGLMGREVPSS